MRYRVASDVLGQEFPGEAVLLNLATTEYFRLQGVGQLIWELLRKGMSRQEIQASLVREYEATDEQIDADLTAFLDHLVELKLIAIEQP